MDVHPPKKGIYRYWPIPISWEYRNFKRQKMSRERDLKISRQRLWLQSYRPTGSSLWASQLFETSTGLPRLYLYGIQQGASTTMISLWKKWYVTMSHHSPIACSMVMQPRNFPRRGAHFRHKFELTWGINCWGSLGAYNGLIWGITGFTWDIMGSLGA